MTTNNACTSAGAAQSAPHPHCPLAAHYTTEMTSSLNVQTQQQLRYCFKSLFASSCSSSSIQRTMLEYMVAAPSSVTLSSQQDRQQAAEGGDHSTRKQRASASSPTRWELLTRALSSSAAASTTTTTVDAFLFFDRDDEECNEKNKKATPSSLSLLESCAATSVAWWYLGLHLLVGDVASTTVSSSDKIRAPNNSRKNLAHRLSLEECREIAQCLWNVDTGATIFTLIAQAGAKQFLRRLVAFRALPLLHRLLLDVGFLFDWVTYDDFILSLLLHGQMRSVVDLDFGAVLPSSSSSAGGGERGKATAASSTSAVAVAVKNFQDDIAETFLSAEISEAAATRCIIASVDPFVLSNSDRRSKVGIFPGMVKSIPCSVSTSTTSAALSETALRVLQPLQVSTDDTDNERGQRVDSSLSLSASHRSSSSASSTPSPPSVASSPPSSHPSSSLMALSMTSSGGWCSNSSRDPRGTNLFHFLVAYRATRALAQIAVLAQRHLDIVVETQQKHRQQQHKHERQQTSRTHASTEGNNAKAAEDECHRPPTQEEKILLSSTFLASVRNALCTVSFIGSTPLHVAARGPSHVLYKFQQHQQQNSSTTRGNTDNNVTSPGPKRYAHSAAFATPTSSLYLQQSVPVKIMSLVLQLHQLVFSDTSKAVDDHHQQPEPQQAHAVGTSSFSATSAGTSSVVVPRFEALMRSVLSKDADSSTPLHVAAKCGMHSLVDRLVDQVVRWGGAAAFEKQQQRRHRQQGVHFGHSTRDDDDDDNGNDQDEDEGEGAAPKSDSSLPPFVVQWVDALVNATDYSGATPLYFAVNKKQHDAATSLLARGADPNMANRSGVSPLDVAVRDEDAKMVCLLLQHGAVPRPDAVKDLMLRHVNTTLSAQSELVLSELQGVAALHAAASAEVSVPDYYVTITLWMVFFYCILFLAKSIVLL